MSEARIRVSATDDASKVLGNVRKELSSIEKTSQSMRAALGVAFAGLSVAGIGAAIVGVSEYADNMGKLAQRAGVTAEAISGLAYAAKLSDVDNEQLAYGLRKLGNEAAAGGDKFKALGISLKDSSGNAKTSQELFGDIAEKILDIKDPMLQAAVASKLFGERIGPQLLPLLLSGRTGLKDMADEAKRFGLVVSEDAVAQATIFNDNLTRLKSSSQGLVLTLGGPLIAALADSSTFFLNAAQDGGTFNAMILTIGRSLAYMVGQDDIGKLKTQLRDNSNAITMTLQSAEVWQKRADQGIPGASAKADEFKDKARALLAESFRVTAQLKGQAKELEDSGKPPKRADNKTPDLTDFMTDGKNAKDASSDKIAKAQLAADLSDIQAAGQAISDAYANAEKIMEARRTALLVDDDSYYAAKLGFIRLNADAQEAALQAEIDRMGQEQLLGKDKIANQKKMAEAQAKIAKVRADANADSVVNNLQEAAAANKIALAYTEASQAAQDYIDTVKRQNAREVAGVGQGDRSRALAAGLSVIEDKQTAERQKLDAQKRSGQIDQVQFDTYLALSKSTYNQEVQAYQQRTADIQAAQGDWLNGASEAMANYQDQSQDLAKQVESAMTSAFGGMEDALVTFVTTGKLSFTSLANSIVADIARIIIKQEISNAMGVAGSGGGGGLTSLIGMGIGLFSGTAGLASAASGMSGDSLDNMLKLTNNFSGRAAGGPVSASTMYQVNENGPELLSMAGKQYLMMGKQGGNITPNDRIAPSGSPTYITVNVTPPAGASRASAQQWGAAASREMNRASGRNS